MESTTHPPAIDVSHSRLESRLPLAGVIFGLLLAAALVITQNEPGDSASTG